MARISVVGNTGSGKSTMARSLGQLLGHPVLELDAIYHQADWTLLARGELCARVTAFMSAHARWVIDGNYSAVRELVWAQADKVVWLDPPRMANMGTSQSASD